MKTKVARVVIFCVLSFLPFIIFIPMLNAYLGEKLFISERADIIYAVGVFGMLIPSLAQILTRLITREGFANNYLLPNVKGHGRYYLASILVILGNVLVESLLVWKMFLPEYGFSDIFHNVDGIAIALLQIALSLIFFLPAFGEEWGWRGYMMPKLIDLLGKPWAVIVGGIIWGLWHAPLTMSGHNFGVDYPGFPWLGIVLMCVFCIAMNAFLTLLTERTKSIYPACFAHMIHNNLSLGILLAAFSKESVIDALTNKADNLELMIVMLPVSLVVGVVSFWRMVRVDKK